MMEPLIGKTDMIILPEMFSTGFSMSVGQVVGQNKGTLSWMQQQAKKTGALVMGSIPVVDRYYYNRFYWVSPEGKNGYYDKHHLFSMSEESNLFTPGNKKQQFNYTGWEVMPIICYDLRFPAWCRNNLNLPYDLLVCSASWPSVRNDVWMTLLKARALENQCFVAGVNRIGKDVNGLEHNGNSVVFGPKGNMIGILPENQEGIATFQLSISELLDFRKKFPVLNDMDQFSFEQ
jgi:predicted amidohydrolase